VAVNNHKITSLLLWHLVLKRVKKKQI